MNGQVDLKAMGERIKKARQEKGFTHPQLSDALGKDSEGNRVSVTTISRWENGHQAPQRYLGQLARALGKTVEWLEWGDNPPKQATLFSDEEIERMRAALESHGYKVEQTKRSRRSPPPSLLSRSDARHRVTYRVFR